MSERPPPKRVGPPILTALIAIIAGVCWWTQDQYGWMDVQPTHASATPAAAPPASVNVTPPPPPVVSRPSTAPVVPASAAPAPDPLTESVTTPQSSVAAHPVAQAPGAPSQAAKIELAANTVDLAPRQPVASVVVSRRHSYRQEVSFTWSTEPGTAKPGQDFMPVKLRTEYIAPGAPQTRLLVPIVENPRRHLSRTFYVVVNTPGEGATLGERTVTQVTIPASY